MGLDPESMMLAELIKDYGPPVAWIVAIIGLYFNNRSANTREKRKEFRSEIDAIEKIVKDLLGKLNTYNRSKTRDDAAKQTEVEIKVLFREIDMKWDRLARRQSGGELRLLIAPCANCLEQFFDHATDKYFETDDRMPEDELGTHHQQNYILAMMFTEALHSLFLKKFDGI